MANGKGPQAGWVGKGTRPAPPTKPGWSTKNKPSK